MRLTNYLRDAFVRNVANNIPEVKPPELKDIQAKLYSLADPRLQAVYDDEDLRKQLHKSWCFFSTNGNGYVYEFGQKVDELDLVVKYKEANKKREEAIIKIRQAAYGCKTLKELQEALPELKDYMPQEDKPAKINVPMITGVVEALREVGFPKEEKK